MQLPGLADVRPKKVHMINMRRSPLIKCCHATKAGFISFCLGKTVTHSGCACGEPAKLAARAGRVKSIFGRLWQLLKGLAQVQNWTVFSMKRRTKIPTAGFCWRERCFHFTDVCHRNVSPWSHDKGKQELVSSMSTSNTFIFALCRAKVTSRRS